MNTTSNAEEVLTRMLGDTETAEQRLTRHMRLAAVDSVALITNRIQQRGEGSDGQRLQTKSKERVGAYAKQWGKERASRGRRTDQQDWTDTGDLMRNFQPVEVTPRLVTVAFLSDEQADKAEYLEAYHGDAFYPSEREKDQVAESLQQSVIDDLEGR